MPRPQSAALLVCRRRGGDLEFLLAHPGGPFWRKRDDGAWSIPKGLVEPGEDALAAAWREFAEEVGLAITGDAVALTPARQPGGKLIAPWLVEADLDLTGARSADFEMQWPPRSGRMAHFPEVDRVAYFGWDAAQVKILAGQKPILAEARERLGA